MYAVHRATGALAIASSLTPPEQAIEIVCVKLHLDIVGGAAENFTVTINSVAGGVYDVEIFSQDMTAVKDICWVPDRSIPVINKDVIDFAYANTNTRTYGLEVIYRRI